MFIYVEDDDSCLFFILLDLRFSVLLYFFKKDIVYVNIYIYMGNEIKIGLDLNRIVMVFIFGVIVR